VASVRTEEMLKPGQNGMGFDEGWWDLGGCDAACAPSWRSKGKRSMNHEICNCKDRR